MSNIADLKYHINQRHNHRGGGSNHRQGGGGNTHRSRDRIHHHHERIEGGLGVRGCPQRPRKYCHTHGFCAHSNAECDSKGYRHQNISATQNMQGGSTLNCLWLWKCGTESESKLKHSLDYSEDPSIKYHTLSSAIANTDTTGHYLVPSARQYCTYIHLTSAGPSVQVANSANIETSTRATISLSTKLSQQSQVDTSSTTSSLGS